jgi:hypothetical protein
MTGQGVERTPRTAYPDPSVSPTGVSSLMPPHIQGAERRSERRAGHTGSRWGLRALVIGGLAGAAWLLTGAAAHAADRDPGPVGPLIGSIVDGGATAPVTGLLQAAAQPLETVGPAHKHHEFRYDAQTYDIVASVLEVPHRVLVRPAETLDEVVHGHSGIRVDAAISSVDEVLREVAGPLRLTGGPTPTQQSVLTHQQMTVPVRRTHKHPIADQPVDDLAPVPAATPMPEVPQVDPVVRVSSTISTTPVVPVKNVQHAKHRKHAKVVSAPSAHRHRIATSVVSRPATGQEYVPGGDGPAAPLQLHLGDVSGTPTSGSGIPTAGGSAALLPAAISDNPMACHLVPFATDVEVRRHDAEAPTVSPD